MLHCRGCGRVYYVTAAEVAAANDLRCECGLPVRHVTPGRDGRAAIANASDDASEYEVAGEPSGQVAVAPEQHAKVLPYLPVDEGVVDARLYFPDRTIDLYAPVVLLGLGAAIGLWELTYLYDDVWEAARFGTAYLIVKLLMLLVCIPLLTRFAGLAFGTLPSATLKLTAIAILPEAVGLGVMLLSGGCMGALLAMPISFCVSWAMFARLFDLDFMESRLCAAVYWAVGLVFGLGWLGLINWLIAIWY